MTTQQEFHRVLTAFAEGIGLDQFEPEGDFAVFGVDETRKMSFRRDADLGVVRCFMELGQIPASDRSEAQQELLRGNIWMVGSNGGALGLDPNSGIASLTCQFDLDEESAEGFQAKVENFLSTADEWIGRLGLGVASADEAGGAQGESGRLDGPDSSWMLRA